MPQENIEVVRRTGAAYNRRDVEGLKRMFHDDAEVYDFLEGRAEESPVRGGAGIARWLAREADIWEEVRADAFDFREVDDWVVAIGRGIARGKGSGVLLEMPAAWVFKVSEGRIRYMRAYRDPSEALEAVGLSE